MMKVVESMELIEEVPLKELGDAELDKLVRGWRREAGSWFERRGEAYWKERSVIRREDDVDGRASVSDQRWRASAARRLNCDEVVQIWRLGGCENFVGKSSTSQCLPLSFRNHTGRKVSRKRLLNGRRT